MYFYIFFRVEYYVFLDYKISFEIFHPKNIKKSVGIFIIILRRDDFGIPYFMGVHEDIKVGCRKNYQQNVRLKMGSSYLFYSFNFLVLVFILNECFLFHH